MCECLPAHWVCACLSTIQLFENRPIDLCAIQAENLNRISCLCDENNNLNPNYNFPFFSNSLILLSINLRSALLLTHSNHFFCLPINRQSSLSLSLSTSSSHVNPHFFTPILKVYLFYVIVRQSRCSKIPKSANAHVCVCLCAQCARSRSTNLNMKSFKFVVCGTMFRHYANAKQMGLIQEKYIYKFHWQIFSFGFLYESNARFATILSLVSHRTVLLYSVFVFCWFWWWSGDPSIVDTHFVLSNNLRSNGNSIVSNKYWILLSLSFCMNKIHFVKCAK